MKKAALILAVQVCCQVVFLMQPTHGSEPTSVAAVNTACKEIGFLTAVKQQIAGRAATLKATLTEIKNEQAMYTIAAMTATGTAKTAYSAFTFLAEAKSISQQTTVGEEESLAVPAIRAIDARIAQLRAALALRKAQALEPQAPTATSAEQGEQWINAGADAKKCVFDVHSTGSAVNGCGDDLTTGQHITEVAKELPTLKKVKLMPADYFTKIEYTAKLQGHGSVGSIGNGKDKGASLTNSQSLGGASDGIGLKNMAAKPAPTPKELHMTTNGGTTDTCDPALTANPSNPQLIVTDKAVAGTICRLRQATVTGGSPIGEADLASLRTDPTMQTIAQLILAGTENKETTESGKEEAVYKVFGGKGTKIADLYIKPLKAKTINLQLATEKQTAKISELADTTSYAYALAVAFHAGRPTQSDPPGKNPKGDETKTGTENPAAEPEEKKGGDNKTNTNTTGRNSFVINKVPSFACICDSIITILRHCCSFL
uniref:Variant surface glycoprotein 1074 n=1 Tax=Trypanosoma brucei TaxID=5691 RepID=M4SVG3_9TRYP|nr:variant surface glycoprotein 1074 [Trypanosoma brucei]